MSVLDSKVSYFKNTKATEVLRDPSKQTLRYWIAQIQEGGFKDEVEKVRDGDDSAKVFLPTVAVHGVFKDFRNAKDFIESTGIIILDIDDIDPEDNLEDVKDDIMTSSSNVVAVMVSPSGNGIKVLFYVDPYLVTRDSYRLIGKELVSRYSHYGHVDYLSLTDTLIMTYDPNILVNEEAVPAFVYVKDIEHNVNVELEPRDPDKQLWTDVEDFFDTVLAKDIEGKTNNNFHFIQVAVFDLAKFGFKHPAEDLSFVIDYAEEAFKRSPDNKRRFLEAVQIANDSIQHSRWAYKVGEEFWDDEEDGEMDYIDYSDHVSTKDKPKNKGSDEDEPDYGNEDDEDDDGFMNYDGDAFWDRILEVAKEGDRVGAEISLKAFAEIFRFKGTGILTVTGIPGHGKAQSLNSRIYTPNGVKLMSDIKIGDKVLTKEGVSNVIGIFPQGKKDIFKITFSDGSSTLCCDDHLWLTNSRKERLKKMPMTVRSLKEIRENITVEGGRSNFNIPVLKSHFDSQNIDLDPYSLGVLLGDGSLTKGTVRLSNQSKDVIIHLNNVLRKFNCKLNIEKEKEKGCYNGCYNVCLSKIDRNKKGVREFMDKNNLNVASIDKHIPRSFLFNSIDVRFKLLQGLLDTDGSILKDNTIEFSTSSIKMKKDFVDLIQSLGGIARVYDRFPKYTYKNETRVSKNISYRIVITLPSDLGNPFFKCRHKVDRWKEQKNPSRFIKSIESHSYEDAQCIMVDNDSHLYFTDNFIVTHNTEFTDACVLDLARLYGHETLMVGYEQRPEEHILKLSRKLIGKNVTCPSYQDKEGLKTMKQAYDFITSKIKHLDTTKIGGNINTVLEKCAKKIKQLRDNGGDPRYVLIDPFNMLSIKGRFSGHEKIEEILRRITQFSHQMGVMVILVAHPFKMKKDEKTGKYEVPDFYSVKGSSAFFEMSYHGLVIYRDGSTVLARVLKVKQNNLGTAGEEVYFAYEKNSGRYIPIDQDQNEVRGDHKATDWLAKAIELNNKNYNK